MVMKKTSKPCVNISFFKRLHSPRPKFHCDEINTKRVIVRHQYNDRLGRVIQSLDLEEVDPIKEFAIYSVNDFSLENLLAVGAQLKPLTLTTDNLSSVSNISSMLSSIDIIDSDNN